jgi:hypothetical protein
MLKFTFLARREVFGFSLGFQRLVFRLAPIQAVQLLPNNSVTFHFFTLARSAHASTRPSFAAASSSCDMEMLTPNFSSTAAIAAAILSTPPGAIAKLVRILNS